MDLSSSSDSSDTFSGSDTDKEVAEPPKEARKRSRSATAVGTCGSGPHRLTNRRHSVHQSASPIGHKEEQDAGQHLEGSSAEVQVSIYVCC